MAQHDYDIANGTGAAVRTDINNVLDAVVSQNSGSSAPSTTYSYQQWADTSAGLLKIRNGANNAWVTVGTLDAANLGLATLASPTLTGNPKSVTPATGDNDTSIATTAFVKTLVDSAVATAVGNLTDAQMPAGSILQVVEVPQSLTNSLEITASSVLVGSQMNVSITPSSAANKILVQFNVNCQATNGYYTAVGVTVFRGSGINTSLSGTNLAGGGGQNTTGVFCIHNAGMGSNLSSDNCLSASVIDSPSSTSSVTYTIAFRKMDVSGQARLGARGAFSTMTLMEIKG